MKHLESYIRSVRPQFEDMLGHAVEIPSVSSDPARRKDLARMATVAAQYGRSLGARVRTVTTKGYPVVSGGWQVGKQYPTLTIYNHLDVQPAQEPEWLQDPFVFRKQGDCYRGRGTTDDKGPALAALLAARYAVEQGVALNIRFLWELEEEIGSPNFQDALDQRSAVPRPDSVLVSDTIWVSRQRPGDLHGVARVIGCPADPAHGNDRRAFRVNRRRGQKPAGRIMRSRPVVRGRANRPRDHSRVLR